MPGMERRLAMCKYEKGKNVIEDAGTGIPVQEGE